MFFRRVYRSCIFTIIFAVFLAPIASLCSAESGKDVAWTLIVSGLHSNRSEERVAVVRVLGLLVNNGKAGELAEHSLEDANAEVRSSAATALGQMHSTASVSRLRQTLSDKEISVALAAARALHAMNDKSGSDFYYEILTGERKGSEGFIAEQTAVLPEPKKLAELGFEQRIGYIHMRGWGGTPRGLSSRMMRRLCGQLRPL